MRIPQPLIDQILDRTDLVELIGSRIKLKKAGKSFTACCPFHGEKTPSFHVHRDKGFYHCFGCQASGNAVGFLMNYEHRSFHDAVAELAQRAGIELPKFDDKPDERTQYKRQNTTASVKKTIASPTLPPPTPTWDQPDPTAPPEYDAIEPIWTADEPEQMGSLYDLLESLALYYQQQLQQHQPARQYLHGRGLDGEACVSWRLGYAPDGWQHLQDAFARDIDGLKQLGLIRQSESGRDFCLLRDRVIFPIRDGKGRVVGFGGRAMSDEVKPKYINSPESSVFNKSQLLYGLYESRKARAKHWLMVEGYMDVIALHQAGLAGAVATLGTASNADHLQQLFRQDSKVILAFDGDEAGQRAAWRTLELALPILTDGRELRFLVLPDEHDPDSLIRLEGLASFEQRLEKAPPLSDFLYEILSRRHDLSHPEGKSALMYDAHELLKLLPERGSYRQLLRQTLRDRVGLGWNKRARPSNDQLLSFDQDCSLENKLFLLILQYPSLAGHLDLLVSCCEPQHPLLQLRQFIALVPHELHDDAEAALFFVLGAWPQPEQTRLWCQLLDRVDVHSYVAQPERADAICQELVLQVSEHALNRRLKTAQSLAEMQQLNTALFQLRRRLHFRELAPITGSA
jgi:DNA primase